MIPVCKPCWGVEEEEAVLRVMRSGRLIQGPEVAAFERAVAECVGVPHAIAASSGTTALHTALLAMGVGPEDEVLVPAFTFVATANAVLACGARVMFNDINLDTFNIEPTVRRRRPMVSVDCFGLPSKYVGLLEDSACALSPAFKLRGWAATFSFHATKPITTGEGGMIVTDDAALAEQCRSLRDQKHGQGMAYNYRMTEVAGAIGQAQMRKLPWIIERRAEIAALYDAELDGQIAARVPPKGGNYQSYALLLNAGRDRARTIEVLAEHGVEALPGTQYLPDMPHLFVRGSFPNAFHAGTHAMRIPCYPTMTDADVQQVIEAVKGVLG